MRAILICLVLLLPAAARAHSFRPGMLSLRQLEPERWAFTAIGAEPTFPERCALHAQEIECPGGLIGQPIRFRALGKSEVVASIELLDGRTLTETIRAEQPVLIIPADPSAIEELIAALQRRISLQRIAMLLVIGALLRARWAQIASTRVGPSGSIKKRNFVALSV